MKNLTTKFPVTNGEKPSIARIEGYASVYGKTDLNGDCVAPGAFTKSLKKFFSKNLSNTPQGALMMLYQHKVDCPVGRWIDVRSDEKGLYVIGELLLDSAKAREVYALLKGRALNGLSIGFRTVKAEKRSQKQRIIREADLWEVSIVSFPMASQARITHVGDAQMSESENPERAGLCTQPARRASFPPSGARHHAKAPQLAQMLRSAADILSNQ